MKLEILHKRAIMMKHTFPSAYTADFEVLIIGGGAAGLAAGGNVFAQKVLLAIERRLK